MVHFIQDPAYTFELDFLEQQFRCVDELACAIECACAEALGAGACGYAMVRVHFYNAEVMAWFLAQGDTVYLLSVLNRNYDPADFWKAG